MKNEFPEMMEDEPESAEEAAMEMVTPGAEAAEVATDMSIMLPEGFQPPEGTKDGDTFEVIAKAKVVDGRMVFESFDGQPTKTDSEESGESDAAAEEALRTAMKTERG